MGIEETSKGICDSLLDLPKLLESGPKGDIVSAFEKISETLKENANNRKEGLKAAAAELPAAEELLEAVEDQSKAAYELSEAVDKAKDAVLGLLESEYKAKFNTATGRAAGSAYGAIWTAYVIARLASAAAASAMEATVSETRAATASKVAPTASRKTAEASAADAKTAAGVAKDAAKGASALAVQAAAGSLDQLKKLKDLMREGIVEEINRGIKELEAVVAVTEATKRIVGGMVLQTEGKAADAEQAARNATAAAAEAEAVGGTVAVAVTGGAVAVTTGGTAETVRGEKEGEAEESPPKEETVQKFLEELDCLMHTNDFLKQSLGGATVQQKLPEETQKSLSELETFQERKLAEFSQKNSHKSAEELLEGSLKIMREIGQFRKDMVREQILKLNDFQKLDELNRLLDNEDSEQGFLRNDLELRRENLKKREAAFEKSGKCLFCASPAEIATASGETDSTTDLSLRVNCIFNNKYMRALVDTGATCNVVSEAWIKKHNMLQDAKRYQSLMLANGSVTDNCPCLVGPWMLKIKGAPGIYWKDVEFVMLKGHREDALLGLPFLRLTQIIHSSTGQLLFAEYEGISRKESAPRPIYGPTTDASEPN